jgi:hypothetical protein
MGLKVFPGVFVAFVVSFSFHFTIFTTLASSCLMINLLVLPFASCPFSSDEQFRNNARAGNEGFFVCWDFPFLHVSLGALLICKTKSRFALAHHKTDKEYFIPLRES